MKKIKAIIFLLVTVSMFSFNEEGMVKTEKEETKDPKALNPPVTQVLIGEDLGSANIIFDSIAGLEAELELYYAYESVYALEILDEGGEYWLSGKGENPDDTLHYVFVLQLHDQGGGDLYLTKGDAASQTCTSKGCCTGCQINVISETSGSCDCISDNCALLSSDKSCEHSVSVITGSNAEFDSMIDNLDAM